MIDKSSKKQGTLQKLGMALLFISLLIYCVIFGLTSVTTQYIEYVPPARWAALGFGGAGILALLVAFRSEIWGAAKSRQGRYGANMVLAVTAFFGIMGVINYMGSRHNWRYDVTEAKTFSLSEQTQRILGNLENEVKITAFFSENNPSRREAKDLLDNYAYMSKEKVKVEFIDPDRQPGVAAKFGIKQYNSSVFEANGKQKIVTGMLEQDFTNGLLSVTRGKQPKIYFVEGYGEHSLDDMSERGISQVKSSLEKDNYLIDKLYLEQARKVPDDADVIVMNGPQKPVSPEARQALETYISKGGRAMIMLDPRVPTGLEVLLAKYGVNVGNDLVLDLQFNLNNDPATPAIAKYPYHDITKDFRILTVFPRSRTVKVAAEMPKGVSGSNLTETSPNSWAESDLMGTSVKFDEGADQKGPLSIAAALTVDPDLFGKSAPASPDPEKKAKAGRLVVFGNALFNNNGFSRVPGNSDFFLNSVSWLAEQGDLIAIRAKDKNDKRIEFSGNQMTTVFYSTVLGAPFLMLCMGFAVWWRRR